MMRFLIGLSFVQCQTFAPIWLETYKLLQPYNNISFAIVDVTEEEGNQ
jgi:hypothetical protein